MLSLAQRRLVSFCSPGMGVRCCSGKSTNGVYKRTDDILFPGGVYNTSNNSHGNLLFLGPEGSGKTTLLYATLIPEWGDIASEMTPTKGVHLEMLKRGNAKVGLWDVGGSTPAQFIWPLLYRFVSFKAIVFVISSLDRESSTEAKEWLQRLTAEEELRKALILVVVNSFDQNIPDETVESILATLKISHLQKQLETPQRLRWFVVNARAAERDQNWQAFLDWAANNNSGGAGLTSSSGLASAPNS